MSDITQITVIFPDPVIQAVVLPAQGEITSVDIGTVAPPSEIDLNYDQEIFTAASDGQVAYTLAHSPLPGSALVFINGLLEPEAEYSISTNHLNFTSGSGIASGDKIGIFYFY